MPFPATRVLHPDWSAHHRPTAESAMTVGMMFTRAGTGEGTYNDPATGGDGTTTPPARTDVAATTARIQARNASERVVLVGENTVTLRTYLVAVPVDAGDIRVDDHGEVTSVAADADPELLGLVLRVRDVIYGSEVWQRDLICEDDLG